MCESVDSLKVHVHVNIIHCRYVIVKVVRKDHLDQLPVPNRMKKYLNTPFYYSEQVQKIFTKTLFSCENDLTWILLGSW